MQLQAMTEAALLHLTPRPRTSKKSELCTLLLMSLTTVTVASAFNFAGAYFWVGNFDHDMRYIAAFHIFEFAIIFAGMIFLTIGIIANSITFIAIFIATLSISSISRILCIAFSFGFITFDEKRCFKTFYASIHRDLRKGVGSDDRILAELLCKRDVCISLLVISAVLLIFHVASIISAFRYTKILRYEKEAKLRRLLKATAFSPSSLSVEEGYSDEEGDRHKSTESTSTSPSNTRSSSSKSYENSYTPNENISTKNAPTVDEVVQSTTGYSNHSTKSVDSISSRPSCMMKSSSDGNGIGSIDFDV